MAQQPGLLECPETPGPRAPTPGGMAVEKIANFRTTGKIGLTTLAPVVQAGPYNRDV